jgi:predicted O-linked N-acetylglucosamine transferase (SPINDLY family)
MDALWAGVPILTLGGAKAEQRAGTSLLAAVGGPVAAAGVVFSLKQYEDAAVALVMDPTRLALLRGALANRCAPSRMLPPPRS